MSGGSNNATVSFPGPDWMMLWPDEFENFQLDIVGFLAILGEASILANAQVSALSRLFYLPRLLPAPQALLRVSRPVSLSPVPANVTAVTTGNKKQHIHHIASVLLGTDPDKLQKYWVRCVQVTKNAPKDLKLPQAQTLVDRFFRGQPSQKAVDEKGNPQEPIHASIKAKAAGPLTWVTLLGFSLSIAIIVISVVYGDGMSLMAALALSLLSTLVGICNKWELRLPDRDKKDVPDGTTVIRYPDGGFLVVRCDDVIARELFFAPEEIDYTIKSLTFYRLMALVGSIMLMLGVILLANARLELQICWAGAYLILNAAHWAAAALPAKMHWDLSCYNVEEEGIENGPRNNIFSEALWKAILVTKSTAWVQLGEAAPRTEAWDLWLKEALISAKSATTKEGILTDPVRDWCRAGADGTLKGTIHCLPPSGFDAKAVFAEKQKQVIAEEQLDAEEGQRFHPSGQAAAGATAQDRPATANGQAS